MSARLTRAALVGACLAAALTHVAGGCASAPRFADAPVVWQVDDRKDIPEPEDNPFDKFIYFGDILLFDRINRGLELPTTEYAHNTNALDEVPDSTWFTNRIGVRSISPEEIAHGTSTVGAAQPPLTITAGKVGGGNPGFFVKDRRGIKFLIKFDTLDNPEMQTATSVIVNRIMWALGFFVPNDDVLVFARDELVLAPDAKAFGRKMTEADVDGILKQSPVRPDGRFRASSSQFLSGKPVGGFDPSGTRSDDANDVVDHEHRRELRALRLFAAWVNHTDMKIDNSLDMYVEEDGKRFLRHYLLDFGEALAAHQAEKGRYEDGYEYFWDWEAQTRAFFSFGLWTRPWERLKDTPWLSVGAIDAENFEPEDWREAYPYDPFFEMDDADAFWAAKLVMRFDRPLLEAVVARAQLSQPEAAAYLVDTLLGRARIIGERYLQVVTPLDDIHIDGASLCGVDLGVLYNFTKYGELQRIDADGRILARATARPDGRVCVSRPTGEGYQRVRLQIMRGGGLSGEGKPNALPPLEVHLMADGNPRILGLMRTDRE